jgi:hypothetical protein
MIKPEELRIGNYYLFQGAPTAIEAHDLKYLSNMKSKGQKCENYQYLPLTEEILIRAGFKWSIYHQAFHKDEFRFDLNSLQNGGYSLSTFKQNLIIIYKIEYVHQIQNLYWCLIGEELVINF